MACMLSGPSAAIDWGRVCAYVLAWVSARTPTRTAFLVSVLVSACAHRGALPGDGIGPLTGFELDANATIGCVGVKALEPETSRPAGEEEPGHF